MTTFLMEKDHRRKIWYEKDPVTGLIGVHVEYNNDMHLGATKTARDNTEGGFKSRKSKDGFDMHHISHIPDSVVLLELVPRGICLPGGALVPGADKAFLKWLDKAENAVFRVKRGRLT